MTTPGVIFIDIDGVMIPFRDNEPSPEAFKVLKMLRGEPPCPLMLISAWRFGQLPEAMALFGEAGCGVSGVADERFISKADAVKESCWAEGFVTGDGEQALIIDDDAHRFADEIPWATCISPDPSRGLVMEDVSELLNAPMGRKGE